MEHEGDPEHRADQVAAKKVNLVAPLGYHIENGKIVRDWDAPEWLGWGLANLDRENTSVENAKLFGACIPALEAGIRPPVDLIRRMQGMAPKDAKFALFPLLPYDIRHMIWDEAARSNKNEVRVTFSNKEEFGRITDVKITNKNANPPLLRVNREARNIAKKYYTKILGTKWHRPSTLFNFDKDRVFFQTADIKEFAALARFIKKKDGHRLRHIVIPFRDFLKGDEIALGWTIAMAFPNLRSLRVVLALGEEDKKVLSPACLNGHMRGMTKVMKNSWRKFKIPRQPPVVKYEFVHEIQAHYWGVDGLAW